MWNWFLYWFIFWFVVILWLCSCEFDIGLWLYFIGFCWLLFSGFVCMYRCGVLGDWFGFVEIGMCSLISVCLVSLGVYCIVCKLYLVLKIFILSIVCWFIWLLMNVWFVWDWLLMIFENVYFIDEMWYSSGYGKCFWKILL